MAAALAQDKYTCELLSKHKADISLAINNKTAFHYAMHDLNAPSGAKPPSIRWNNSLITLFLNLGSSPDVVIAKYRLIQHVIINKLDALFTLLLSKNVELNYQAVDGSSGVPLRVATRCHHKEFDFFTPILEKTNQIGRQHALIDAVKSPSIEYLERLINNTENLPWTFTSIPSPLILAFQIHNKIAIKMFIKENCFLQSCDSNRNNVLMLLLQEMPDDEVLIQSLLDRRIVDVNASNLDGETAIHIASRTSSPKVLQMLLSKKADINAAHPTHGNALLIALSAFKKQNAQFLLENNINVTAVCKDKTHALHKLFSMLVIKNIGTVPANVILEHLKDVETLFLMLLQRGCYIDDNQRGPTEKNLLTTLVEYLRNLRDSIDNIPEISIKLKKDIIAILSSIRSRREKNSKMLSFITNGPTTIFPVGIEEIDLFTEPHGLGIYNSRRILDGKTALHLVLEKNNLWLIFKLFQLSSDESFNLPDNNCYKANHLMSSLHHSIFNSCQLFHKISKLITEINQDLKTNSLMKENHVVAEKKNKEDMAGLHKKTDEEIFQEKVVALKKLGDDCFVSIEKIKSETLPNLQKESKEAAEAKEKIAQENEKMIIKIKGLLYIQLCKYFYQSGKVQLWDYPNLAKRAVSAVSETLDPEYSIAQDILFELVLCHDECESGNDQTKQILDACIRSFNIGTDDQRSIKKCILPKLGSQYVFSQPEFHAPKNLEGGLNDILIETFDHLKTKHGDITGKLTQENEKLEKELKASSAINSKLEQELLESKTRLEQANQLLRKHKLLQLDASTGSSSSSSSSVSLCSLTSLADIALGFPGLSSSSSSSSTSNAPGSSSAPSSSSSTRALDTASSSSFKASSSSSSLSSSSLSGASSSSGLLKLSKTSHPSSSSSSTALYKPEALATSSSSSSSSSASALLQYQKYQLDTSLGVNGSEHNGTNSAQHTQSYIGKKRKVEEPAGNAENDSTQASNPKKAKPTLD